MPLSIPIVPHHLANRCLLLPRHLRAQLLYQDGHSCAFIPWRHFFHNRWIIFAPRCVLSWWGRRAVSPCGPHEQV